MFILKIIMKFFKVLGSETAPAALAAAVTLGMLLGFNPLLSIQGLLIITILVFFRVNIATFLFAWGMSTVIYILCYTPIEALGASVLESEGLRGTLTGLYHSVFYYTGFSNSLHMGGIIISSILCIPVFIGALVFVRWYRGSLEPKVLNSKAYKALRASKLYSMYCALTSPLGGGDA